MSKSSNPEPFRIPVNPEGLAKLRERAEQWSVAQQQASNPTSSGGATPTTKLRGVGASRGSLEKINTLRTEARQRREEAAAATGATCADCCDTGWHYAHRPCDCPAGAERVQREDDERRTKWLLSVDDSLEIPRRYRNCTLDSFGNQSSPVLVTLREWLAGDRDRGIYLYGEFGRGKTGLMIAAMREYVLLSGQRDDYRRRPLAFARFVTATGMLQSLRPGGYEDDTAKVLRSLSTTGLLVIDDLGAERLTDWGADRVFEIVNSRHNAELVTMVTSNLPPDDLANRITHQVGMKMGDRIVERLVESCDVLAFDPSETNWRTAA